MEKKSILYVQTSDDPERQYSPLVLAQTAKAMDIDAKVYFLGQALRVLKPDQAEKIKLGEFPSFGQMLQKTMNMGIEVYVCEASKQMLGWENVQLIKGRIRIVDAGTEMPMLNQSIYLVCPDNTGLYYKTDTDGWLELDLGLGEYTLNAVGIDVQDLTASMTWTSTGPMNETVKLSLREDR